MTRKNGTSRRNFLVAAGAATAATTLLTSTAYAAGNDTIKVGLIGCGGRGKGAAENVLHAAKGVEIVALADYFPERSKGLRNHLAEFTKNDEKCKNLGNTSSVTEERCFGGLDAAEQVINLPDVNYIILATPPGFRPQHLQAAVAAGKNIFTEKPVAVDGPGIRKVLEAYEEAQKKKLAIAAGTQRRHQLGYLETIKRIQDGAIGEILSARCYWNQGNIWFNARQANQTDVDYQIYNWYHFGWLCGDHIVEQHVHNLDVINWATGKHPIRCLGMGGRVRPCNDPNRDGHIYNFFAIEYEYEGGMRMLSQSRQINGCDHNFPGISGQAEALVGTKGLCQANTFTINGETVVTQAGTNPYVQEHTDLIFSIRASKPINELKNVAESTLTAIMGRMSAYTGKLVTWQQALNSKQELMPAKLTRDTKLTAYAVPVPGTTKLF